MAHKVEATDDIGTLSLAQTKLLCEFCDASDKVQWKCFDCELCLCEPCKKKVHSKVKAAKLHEIVDINNSKLMKETKEKISLCKIPCQKHPNQMSCLFCKRCDELVCAACLFKSHQHHIFEDIPVAYIDKKSKLITKENTLKTKVTSFGNVKENKRSMLESLKRKTNQEVQQTRQKIIAQRDFIMQTLTDFSSQFLKDFDSNVNSFNDFVQTYMKTLDKIEQELLGKLNTIHDVLASDDPDTVFVKYKDLVRDDEPKIPRLNLPHFPEYFVFEKITKDTIKQFFGQMADVQKIKTHSTDVSDIKKIASIKSNVWILSLSNLMCTDLTCSLSNVVKTPVIDFAVTPSRDLLTVRDKTNKVEATSNNIPNLFLNIDMTPLQPISIHVNSEGDILVGVIENTDKKYELTHDSKRQLIVLTPDKEVKTECSEHKRNFKDENWKRLVHEFSKYKKRLFTYIMRITTTDTKVKDICVIDCLSEECNGRVLKLGWDGELKWIYSGNLDINTESKTFRPFDIATTSLGNMIVLDKDTHFLDVLSGNNGSLLTQVATETMEINLPQSLYMDNLNQLWVGCGTCRAEKENAKIHILKLSGI